MGGLPSNRWIRIVFDVAFDLTGPFRGMETGHQVECHVDSSRDSAAVTTSPLSTQRSSGLGSIDWSRLVRRSMALQYVVAGRFVRRPAAA